MINLVIVMTLRCVYLFIYASPAASFRNITKMERGDGAVSQGGIVSSLLLPTSEMALCIETHVLY